VLRLVVVPRPGAVLALTVVPGRAGAGGPGQEQGLVVAPLFRSARKNAPGH